MGATKIFLACSLALLAVMTPGTGARAQTGHLGRRITVHFTQVPLENALEEIGKAGDFRFSYNSDLIEQEKRVTVSATDRKVDAVLKDLMSSVHLATSWVIVAAVAVRRERRLSRHYAAVMTGVNGVDLAAALCRQETQPDQRFHQFGSKAL